MRLARRLQASLPQVALAATALAAQPAAADSHAAAGVALAWTAHSDYGEETFWRLLPEAVAYGYVPVTGHFFLRPGVRVNYTDDQPQMPQSVRIEETDMMTSAELGIIFDWHVVPSLTFGYGEDFRTIKLKTEAPVDTVDDRISGKQTLAFWSAQLGAGVPLVRGTLTMEPFARYWSINQDDRSHWSFGFETTARLF